MFININYAATSYSLNSRVLYPYTLLRLWKTFKESFIREKVNEFLFATFNVLCYEILKLALSCCHLSWFSFASWMITKNLLPILDFLFKVWLIKYFFDRLRQPLDGDDSLLHHVPSILDIVGYREDMIDSSVLQASATGSNVSGVNRAPSPPTTCFPLLASSSSSSLPGRVGADKFNDTLEPSYFSPYYSTALSVTIAIGKHILFFLSNLCFAALGCQFVDIR